MKEKARACAVQVRIWPDMGPEDVEMSLFGLANQARDIQADLIVFPEYLGFFYQLLLLGESPHQLLEELLIRGAQSKRSLKRAAKLADAVRGLFSKIAMLAKSHVVSSSFLDAEESRCCFKSCVFGPEGKILGKQTKIHLSGLDRTFGVEPGNRLALVSCEAGNIGLVIGYDSYFPEVSRVYGLSGAHVLAGVSSHLVRLNGKAPHDPGAMDFNEFVQACGIWKQAQSDQLFGIESHLVGTFGPLEFCGLASVIFPCEMTQDGSGFRARATDRNSTLLVCEDLDFVELRANAKRYPIYSSLNIGAYRDVLMEYYMSLKTRS